MRRWAVVLLLASACASVREVSQPPELHVRIPRYGSAGEPVCAPANVVVDGHTLYLDGVAVPNIGALEAKLGGWPEHCQHMFVSAPPELPYSKLLPVIALAARHQMTISFGCKMSETKFMVVG